MFNPMCIYIYLSICAYIYIYYDMDMSQSSSPEFIIFTIEVILRSLPLTNPRLRCLRVQRCAKGIDGAHQNDAKPGTG